MRKPRKPTPINVETLERCLDNLAHIMKREGSRAHLYVPLWKRVEQELEEYKDRERTVQIALARLTRSTDQTAAQS